MNYLIVAAHPDDEVLGCGASIAKWSKEGHNVHILIMAEGETSRDNKRNIISKKKEITHLKKCAKKSSIILGAKSINFLDFPDNRMDSIDLLDIIKSIEYYIRKFSPEIVVTHHLGDLNVDHNLTHKAILTACRPEPGSNIKKILSFEVSSSTDWQSVSSGVPFIPNYFENVKEFFHKKLEALEIYSSEMKDWPHSRSIKAISNLASLRGSSVGVELAEAFMMMRRIG